MDKPQTEQIQTTNEAKKVSDLTMAELRQFVLDLIDERLFELEQNLPDPDAGLKFKPELERELIEELKKPIEQRRGKSLEDVMREADLNE